MATSATNQTILEFTVVEAKDLTPKDSNGKSDPYFYWWLDLNESKKEKSTIQKKTLNPRWDQTWRVTIDEAKNKIITVELWDKDPTTDDFMGLVKVFIADALQTPGKLIDVWYPVGKRKPNDKVSGQLHVRMRAARNPWERLPPMKQRRHGHSATLLSNGKVLFVGGTPQLEYAALNTVEAYDPEKKEFQLLRSCKYNHAYHCATLLPSGQVMIIGGYADKQPQEVKVNSVVELYNPDTDDRNTWVDLKPMLEPRYCHTSTLLQNGCVFVAGGVGTVKGKETTESFDPYKNMWTQCSKMKTGRFAHTATLLPDGRVVIIGGMTDFTPTGALSTIELYDPKTNSWSHGPPLDFPAVHHCVVPLPEGRIVIFPGSNWWPLGIFNRTKNLYRSVYCYDPRNNKLENVGRVDHSGGAACLLRDGRIIALSGELRDSVYSPPNAHILEVSKLFTHKVTWPRLHVPHLSGRFDYSCTVLQNGNVLIAGGLDDNKAVTNTAELLHADWPF
jgi:hypothetical protein